MDLFQSCGHCWVFQICWHIECSTFTASSFRIWNSSAGIPSPPLALFIPEAHLSLHSRISGSRWVITPSWLPGSWCFWTVVVKKTLESHLDCKEIYPVYPKGNQSWIFFGRTDAEAETSTLWPPDAKNGLSSKDPDAGKDWRPEEKGLTEDEMVGWHHWLNGHEFE